MQDRVQTRPECRTPRRPVFRPTWVPNLEIDQPQCLRRTNTLQGTCLDLSLKLSPLARRSQMQRRRARSSETYQPGAPGLFTSASRLTAPAATIQIHTPRNGQAKRGGPPHGPRDRPQVDRSRRCRPPFFGLGRHLRTRCRAHLSFAHNGLQMSESPSPRLRLQ